MMSFPLTLNWLRHRSEKQFGYAEVVTRRTNGAILRQTYQTIAQRSLQLAQRLIGSGLQAGDKVGTLMWNHYAHLEAYFGVPAAGGVLHTLNHRLSEDDLVYIINHAKDRVLLIDDTLLPVYDAIRNRLTTVDRIIVFNFSGDAIAHGHTDYDDWISQADEHLELPDVQEETPASLCYTGGSTGRPKGVVYTHRALVMHAFCQAMTDGYGVGRADCILGVVPMFHGNGWGLPFVAALTGAKLVLPGSRVDAGSLLELINTEGVTFSAGVPTVWLELAKALEDQNQPDKRSWPISIVTGGAAPPNTLFSRLARFNIDLLQGWGMTETASVITISAPDEASQLSGKNAESGSQEWRYRQGKPMAIVDLRIANGDEELPTDGRTTGEIQVRGACVSRQYFGQDLPDRWTRDGWLRTGDIGTIDQHGNLQVLERTEDMIKSGGEWIIPQALENAILTFPGILECTVIAVPHEKWGERPLALVVESPGTSVNTNDVYAHLEKAFAKWQMPDAILTLPSIPRTAVGKIARRELRHQYAGFFRVAT